MHIGQSEFVRRAAEASAAWQAAGNVFPGYVLNIANEARQIFADEQPPPSEPHIDTYVVKMATDCNLRCGKNKEARGIEGGYVCYEYVNDRWRDLPPIMTADNLVILGTHIGTHAARHNLGKVRILFHGGEPLYMPKPEVHYRRVVPALLGAIALNAPEVEVDLRIHTNGTRLLPPILDVFSDYNVKVGVSLDGNRKANDRNRLMKEGDNRGTYGLVERGLNYLRQDAYRHLFAGILTVIDVQNDPVEVYNAVKSFEPPQMDFLLDYATWDKPPYGRALNPSGRLASEARQAELRARQTGLRNSVLRLFDGYFEEEGSPRATPYADWMLAISDRYEADLQEVAAAKARGETPYTPSIRFFESIKRLRRGETSLVESLGMMNGSEVVIRTDLSVELPDSLNASYDGATETGFCLAGDRPDTLEDVEQFMIRKGALGSKERKLTLVCRDCSIVNICGGGPTATRYADGMGFWNPSVYCQDLMKVITRVSHDAVDKPLEQRAAEAIGARNYL